MLTVRRATSSDVATLAAIAAVAYSPYVASIGVRPGPLDVDYADAVDRYDVRVAELDDAPVRLLVLAVRADHLALENVAVDPRAQGQGIGSALLVLAEDEAGSRDLPEVRLYTHRLMTANLALYERRGYVETHRETQDGLDRVLLTKRLSPPAALPPA